VIAVEKLAADILRAGRDPGRALTLVGMGAVRVVPPMPTPPRRVVAEARLHEVVIDFEFPASVGLLLIEMRHDGTDWSVIRAHHRRGGERVYLHRLPSEEQAEVIRFADERLERAS